MSEKFAHHTPVPPENESVELAKELNTTRLTLQQPLGFKKWGSDGVTDRPALRLRINEAMEYIIQSRRQQLDRLVDGFDELSRASPKPRVIRKATKGHDDPRFAVLKERTHIYNRLQNGQ